MHSSKGRRHFLKTMGGVAVAAAALDTAFVSPAFAVARPSDNTVYRIRLRANPDLMIGQARTNSGDELALTKSDARWRIKYLSPATDQSFIIVDETTVHTPPLFGIWWGDNGQQCWVSPVNDPYNERFHFAAHVAADFPTFAKVTRRNYPQWTDLLGVQGDSIVEGTRIFNLSDSNPLFPPAPGNFDQQWTFEQVLNPDGSRIP